MKYLLSTTTTSTYTVHTHQSDFHELSFFLDIYIQDVQLYYKIYLLKLLNQQQLKCWVVFFFNSIEKRYMNLVLFTQETYCIIKAFFLVLYTILNKSEIFCYCKLFFLMMVFQVGISNQTHVIYTLLTWNFFQYRVITQYLSFLW